MWEIIKEFAFLAAAMIKYGQMENVCVESAYSMLMDFVLNVLNLVMKAMEYVIVPWIIIQFLVDQLVLFRAAQILILIGIIKFLVVFVKLLLFGCMEFVKLREIVAKTSNGMEKNASVSVVIKK